MPTDTSLFVRRGSLVNFHRENYTRPCPCRTPEGFRDPEWHKANPDAPECNASGYLTDPIDLQIRGFVQPAFGGRRPNQYIFSQFGEIETDDHIGMFPLGWQGVELDFSNWSETGDEWIEYNNMRFTVIGWSLIPDPNDGDSNHHWECALRRIADSEVGF